MDDNGGTGQLSHLGWLVERYNSVRILLADNGFPEFRLGSEVYNVRNWDTSSMINSLYRKRKKKCSYHQLVVFSWCTFKFGLFLVEGMKLSP